MLKIIIVNIISVIIILFLSLTSMADVVVLKNGMVLNGKVMEKTDTAIIFLSYHGEFTIKQNLISKLHITVNPDEEIKILKKMNKASDKAKIEAFYKREDVKARIEEERKQKELEEEEKNKEKEKISQVDETKHSLTESRFNISIGPVGYYPVGKYREVLTWGYGLSVCTGVKVSDIFYSGKSPFIPELKGEFGYFHFGNEDKGFSGFLFAAGPVWILPFRAYDRFFGGCLIGGSILSVENKKTGYKAKANKQTMIIAGGYSLNIGSVEFVPNIKYLFINDIKPLHSLGLGIAVCYNLF